MDSERALERVDAVLDLISQSYEYDHADDGEARRLADDELTKRLPAVRRIAEAIQPGLHHQMQPQSMMGEWQWFNVRDALLELRGILEDRDELDTILGPVGPKLSARHLHQTIWGASARLWDDGHRRAAIQAAGTAVDQMVQAKLGHFTVSGADLMMQAFSEQPPSDKWNQRLRFPGFADGSEAWISAHEGAKFYAVGCMKRLRNLATHSTEEPNADEALEQLAALSVLARWVDDAVVRTNPSV